MNALSIRILVGLVLGLLAGVALSAWAPEQTPGVLAVARPLGRLWLDALTMTVTPLVFGLVVVGVATPVTTGGATGRALAGFAVLLVGACAVSALVSSALLDLWPVGMALTPPPADPVTAPQLASAGDWVAGLAPSNPVKAAAETAIAPLVLFSLLFGFAARRIDPALRLGLLGVIQAMVETMLVIVRWILWLGPLGVAALAVAVGAQAGAGVFGALAHYVVLVSGVCILIALLAYPVTAVFGRLSPVRFARAALPAQAVALSTQSSLASMPAMIAAAPGLRVAEATAGLVLPLAVSIFRAASAAANVAVVVYLAQVHGVALGPGELTVVVMVAAVVSVGAVGLPAQVSFFATIAPVCLAVGVPVVLLPLLLAVETAPDIFRTLGNVTADLALTRIVGRKDQRGDESAPPAL